MSRPLDIIPGLYDAPYNVTNSVVFKHDDIMYFMTVHVLDKEEIIRLVTKYKKRFYTSNCEQLGGQMKNCYMISYALISETEEARSVIKLHVG